MEGFAKCGTTALCDKLVTHPDVRFYKHKEIDIFTKMHFSDSDFEKRINILYSNESLAKVNSRGKQRHIWEYEGTVWLDCSAGAFRDFNAVAHLKKYSPETKIVMIVRDPWQVSAHQYKNETFYQL
jgi:hypothetical protein